MSGREPLPRHLYYIFPYHPPLAMNPRLLALIPTCVALNVVLGRIVAELGLPIFLDTVGTVTATALAGPWAGIITGLTSQGLVALTSGQMMWLAFAPIQVLIAL